MGVVPPKNTVKKIVVLYASWSILWILLSDIIVASSADATPSDHTIQSIKGVIFVLVTSAILYGLLRWLYRREDTIHESYKKILHDPRQFFWLSDKNGDDLHLSPGFEVITGVSLDVFSRRPWPQFIHPADRENFLKERERAVKSGVGYETTLRLKSRDGGYVQIQVREVPVRNPQTGSIESWVGNATDISDIHHTRRELEQKNAHFRLAERIGGISLWSWDFSSNEVNLSESLAKQLGFNSPVVSGGLGKFLKYIHRDNRPKLVSQVRFVAEGGEPTSEDLYRVRYADGSLHWLITRLSAIKDDDDRVIGITGVNIDITKQKEQQNRLNYIANHDEVTGLYNRNHMLNVIQGAIDSGADQFAVMVLDIDRFGSINSFFGLDFGNALLKELGSRLQSCLRSDDVVGRIASDDFVIFLRLQTSGRQDIDNVASRISEVLRPPFNIFDKSIYLTLSSGSAMYPVDGGAVETLFRNAESALKHARETGGNSYIPYSEDIARKEEESANFISAIKYGVEHKEFYIELQPQYDINQQKYVAAEVLARWKSATLGPVSPVEFIPVAEKLGFIKQISEIVFRDALKLLSHLQSTVCPDFRFSLNLETSQLYESGFVSWLYDMLRDYGVDNRFVELEVTESVLMKDAEQGATVVKYLKDDGFRVAIDDFGTGHSSLGYLGILHANALKIDRSFVQGLIHNENHAIVTETIVMLARNLSLEVVAEGVENREQFDAVSRLGCDLVQGYYFSKPISGDQLKALLQDQIALSSETSV